MGSSDSHDAFTEPAGNAPKHDDAFTQPKKDAPAGDVFYSQSFKDGLAHHWSQICEIRFKAVTSLKDSSSFDDIDFYRYDGGYIKGSELRDCQTGCEMLEKMGYGNAGILSSIPGLKCACKQFDEQLQFVNEEDKPLSNVDYCITRADGMKVKGTTDNGGKTKRIKNTQQEMAIEKVEFFASDCTPFCPKTGILPGMLLASIGLSGIKTTQENVGSSVRKVTLPGKYRQLTPGEIESAKLVFKDSINYGKVKVYNKELLPFGIQKREGNIMTPWGDLYCTEDNFREDYSIDKDEKVKIWFMHEMTHVWQYQLGYNVALHGIITAIRGGYSDGSAYYYDKTSLAKPLPDYHFEKQAEIISHYYAAKYLQRPDYLKYQKTFYEIVLKDFLRSPQNANLLSK